MYQRALPHQGEPSLAGHTRFSSIVAATGHVGLISKMQGTAVRTAVTAGRARPSVPKLSVQSARRYAFSYGVVTPVSNCRFLQLALNLHPSYPAHGHATLAVVKRHQGGRSNWLLQGAVFVDARSLKAPLGPASPHIPTGPTRHEHE